MKETQFTATLTPVIEVATARSLAHPFIVGLSDGTLPLATFRYYLRQDHQYLEMFGRLHEVLAAQLNTALAQILTSLGEGEDLARQRLHAELKLSAVELAAPLDEAAHEQMRQAFVKSCYYEEQFWQMAYEQQRWH